MKKFTLLLTIIVSGILMGQWSDDFDINTLVADTPSGDIQSIGTNDGKMYVIFWDESDGYELRIQLLDVDGTLLWGSNGILANAIADNGTWTATRSQAVDAEGNLYIGFTATNDGNGYVNKISPTGEQLYGANGIAIPDGWDMKLLPLTDGGVIAGWSGGANGTLMRYDASGVEVWDAPLSITSPDAGRPFTGIGELAQLADGSFGLIFHTKGTNWSVDSVPYVQRYTENGEPVWDAALPISTYTLMSNRRYPLMSEGNTLYFAYYGANEFRFDSFLQRINEDGTLPWGENGADFGTDDNFMEMTTSIAYQDGTDHIWAAATMTNANQSQYGIYVQKFNKETGEAMLDFLGKQVFPVDENNWVNVGDLQLAYGNPLILFSNDVSNGVNPIQLGVVLLDDQGEFAWEEEYKMIATSEGNKGRFDFTKNVEGQSIAVWTEPRGGVSKAYAQNIIIEDQTAGINDLNTQIFSIYPNPTNGILNIESKESIEKAEVYALNGQKLKQFDNTKTLNISDLNKGTYLIKLYSKSGGSKTIKLIKK